VLLRSKSLAQGPKEIYKAATECYVWIVAIETSAVGSFDVLLTRMEIVI